MGTALVVLKWLGQFEIHVFWIVQLGPVRLLHVLGVLRLREVRLSSLHLLGCLRLGPAGFFVAATVFKIAGELRDALVYLYLVALDGVSESANLQRLGAAR